MKRGKVRTVTVRFNDGSEQKLPVNFVRPEVQFEPRDLAGAMRMPIETSEEAYAMKHRRYNGVL